MIQYYFDVVPSNLEIPAAFISYVYYKDGVSVSLRNTGNHLRNDSMA